MVIISNQKSVPKKLSFISIYFLGINGVIGSGTFLLPSVIYRYMNLSAVAVLLCTAITVSLIALCYADLSSRFTGSGAAWLYSYHAFGRFTGYELGIFTWFLGCCTLSAEIVALLTTLKSFLPIFNRPLIYGVAAFGLIVLFAVINFFGRGLDYWLIMYQRLRRFLRWSSLLSLGSSLSIKLTSHQWSPKQL